MTDWKNNLVAIRKYWTHLHYGGCFDAYAVRELCAKGAKRSDFREFINEEEKERAYKVSVERHKTYLKLKEQHGAVDATHMRLMHEEKENAIKEGPEQTSHQSQHQGDGKGGLPTQTGDCSLPIYCAEVGREDSKEEGTT